MSSSLEWHPSARVLFGACAWAWRGTPCVWSPLHSPVWQCKHSRSVRRRLSPPSSAVCRSGRQLAWRGSSGCSSCSTDGANPGGPRHPRTSCSFGSVVSRWTGGGVNGTWLRGHDPSAGHQPGGRPPRHGACVWSARLSPASLVRLTPGEPLVKEVMSSTNHTTRQDRGNRATTRGLEMQRREQAQHDPTGLRSAAEHDRHRSEMVDC